MIRGQGGAARAYGLRAGVYVVRIGVGSLSSGVVLRGQHQIGSAVVVEWGVEVDGEPAVVDVHGAFKDLHGRKVVEHSGVGKFAEAGMLQVNLPVALVRQRVVGLKRDRVDIAWASDLALVEELTGNGCVPVADGLK